MDFMNYVVSIALIGIMVQFGEMWMALGATLILIVASKEVKASLLMVITLITIYFINGIGMKEYWLFAVIGLVALGYLLGLGAEEKAADPYAGLLGGEMGGFG
ncbi:MAG: hypothetical protein PHP82_03865 [Candidatus ainarchaeum sp.]|nr:hypothetical protein [Candidatus ainarchaeum sp.]